VLREISSHGEVPVNFRIIGDQFTFGISKKKCLVKGKQMWLSRGETTNLKKEGRKTGRLRKTKNTMKVSGAENEKQVS